MNTRNKYEIEFTGRREARYRFISDVELARLKRETRRVVWASRLTTLLFAVAVGLLVWTLWESELRALWEWVLFQGGAWVRWSAAQGTVRTPLGGMPLALVPMTSVVMWAVLGVVVVLLVSLIVRAWIERCAGDEPDKETRRQSDDGTMRLGDFETAQAGSLCHEEQPLAGPAEELGELMPVGMTHEMMVAILKAVSVELQIVRRMCEGAARSLDVEDYGDALAGVVKRLAQLRVTMEELRARFTPDNQTVRGGDNEPRAFDASLSHGLSVSWSLNGGTLKREQQTQEGLV
jgi:hypothetical protein